MIGLELDVDDCAVAVDAVYLSEAFRGRPATGIDAELMRRARALAAVFHAAGEAQALPGVGCANDE